MIKPNITGVKDPSVRGYSSLLPSTPLHSKAGAARLFRIVLLKSEHVPDLGIQKSRYGVHLRVAADRSPRRYVVEESPMVRPACETAAF